MPTVWLDRDEAVNGDLPPVCMRCGAEATTIRKQTLSWCPSWVIVLIFIGVLIWIIVAAILTKRMTLRAPMCERHAGHWSRFKLFVYGGLLGAVAVLIGGIILHGETDQTAKAVAGWVVGAGVVCFLIVLFTGAVWQTTLIRAVEITDRDMKVRGVCEEFKLALREQRRAEREVEADEPPRKRRPKYDDD
jgi:hypothetical protein